jgi:DNA-binding protein H-NS
LDTKFNIYKETTNEFTGNNELQNPSIIFSMERKDLYQQLVPVDYIDVVGALEEIQEAVDARAAAREEERRRVEEMTRKCYDYQAVWTNRQIDLFNRVYYIKNLATRKKREKEAGNLNDVKGWINKQNEVKDGYRVDNCSEYTAGGVKGLVDEYITEQFLMDLDVATNIPADMTFTLRFVRAKVEDG